MIVTPSLKEFNSAIINIEGKPLKSDHAYTLANNHNVSGDNAVTIQTNQSSEILSVTLAPKPEPSAVLGIG